jgi:RNA polymerase sigma-70 factor (ECF subfamily)
MDALNAIDKDPTTAHVIRARKGDPAAREWIAARAYAAGLRLATFSLGDPNLAQDVGQEVAIRALRGLQKLRDVNRFDAWIYRICAREVKRAAKRRTRQSWHPMDDAKPALRVEAVFTESLSERDWLVQALDRLSHRQRLVLGLRYVHGLDDREIATVIRARRGTVRSLLSRALARLREEAELEEQGGRAPAEVISMQKKEGVR